MHLFTILQLVSVESVFLGRLQPNATNSSTPSKGEFDQWGRFAPFKNGSGIRANPMEEIHKEAQKHHKEHGKSDKPLMDGIESFRVQMCIGRPDILKHKKCMKFLMKKCAKETSGQGFCLTFA